jgi:glycosyltransferase involved in cell wall biosynthesis
MRVLMTADTLGGVWTYALELIRACGDQAEFVLATMGAPLTTAQRAEAAAQPNLTVYEGAYQLEWMDAPWEDVERAGEWLLSLEREYRPDIVHLNGYAHGALAWQAPVLIVGHSCVLSWWAAVKGEPAPERYADYQRQVTNGLQGATAVVAPTNAMLRALEQHYGALPTALVIPNGRAQTANMPAAKEHLILAAGRLWDEAKNIPALTQAAARVSWPVFIAGENIHPATGALTELKNVQQLGRLSSRDLASWMSHASIFALPARYEPFGLTPLEAALAGCALVLGDIPSLREVWGDAALYVPPDSTQILIRVLNYLIDFPSFCQVMAARALDRAHIYAPDLFATRYLELYQQLIAGQRGNA